MTFFPAAAMRDGQVGGGRRLALLSDRARHEDHLGLRIEVREVEADPQLLVRLAVDAVRVGQECQLVVLSHLLVGPRQTAEERQAELAGDLLGRADAGVERLTGEHQADAHAPGRG